jgi:hypothetical protein
MTIDEFLLLRQEEGPARAVVAESPGSRAVHPLQDVKGQMTARLDELRGKWLSLVLWSLAVGALLPRLLAAGYLSRKVRKLQAQVLLDLSEPYYKALQRETISYQRQPASDPPGDASADDKKVWWKPTTWVRKTRKSREAI